MERTLTRYIRALRLSGATVSTAEAIDAARTLELVGYSDRDHLKMSLGIVLAKTTEDLALHEDMFERFFANAGAEQQPKSSAPTGADTDKVQDQAQRDGSDPAEADAFLQLAGSPDAGAIDMALERSADAAGADDIRFRSQSGYFVRRMLEQLGVRRLEERLLRLLQAGSSEAMEEAQTLMDARSSMQARARLLVERRFEVFGRPATEAFMGEVVTTRSISELTQRDMARMKLIVARMARRLAVKHSRRRKSRRRGQLDIRRTMRVNARYEGAPVELVWKSKRRDRPKLVVLCDVSGSVAAYVEFLLLLLYALHEGVADLRAFAFSNRLHDVDPYFRTRNFEGAMRAIVRDVGGGSTDYGQALADLYSDNWDSIDRHTTLLVLGDGRSNHTDPRIDIFQEAAARAKRVVWLCPEQEGMWGTGDSCLLRYKPFCTHLSHCSTAADIERAVDEALAAYS